MQATDNGPTTRLRLADHVRVCKVGDQVVLLDLLHGRYIGLDGKQAHALGDAIDGWPTGEPAFKVAHCGDEVARLIRPLVARGLLAPHTREPRPVIGIEEPASSLDGHEAMAATPAGLRDVGRFLHAAAAARLSLRWRSLHSIAKAVADRRARMEFNGDGTSAERLRGAIVTFDRLRPWVFTARDQCLFDSLALVNFLAGERLFPQWVIGVKTCPFRAHSWVQSGAVVLNDQPENVRRFKPIFVV